MILECIFMMFYYKDNFVNIFIVTNLRYIWRVRIKDKIDMNLDN